MSLVPVAMHPLMHPKHAVEAHMRQRHTIIKGLASSGMSNHRVIDFMHCISDSNEAPKNRLTSIKMHTHTRTRFTLQLGATRSLLPPSSPPRSSWYNRKGTQQQEAWPHCAAAWSLPVGTDSSAPRATDASHVWRQTTRAEAEEWDITPTNVSNHHVMPNHNHMSYSSDWETAVPAALLAVSPTCPFTSCCPPRPAQWKGRTTSCYQQQNFLRDITIVWFSEKSAKTELFQYIFTFVLYPFHLYYV